MLGTPTHRERTRLFFTVNDRLFGLQDRDTPQLLINAETGQVGSSTNSSGNLTNRDLR
jgi:hypothetical protein